MVLLNGASVWAGEPRLCLANRVIGPTEISQLVALFRQFGVVPMVYGTDENGGVLYHETRSVNDILATYLNKRRSAVGAIHETDDLLDLGLQEALEVGTIDVKDKISALSKAIGEELEGRVKVINTRSLLGGGLYYWAEVFHASCDKGSGLKVLRGHYPEFAGPLVAIGDNYNDLDMFMAADFSVAMGNSPTDVKSKADLVTASVSEGGAALVLDQLARGVFPPQ
jgi:hydroxymethylpyrimidine pyrophosphatase-like HAD family hydrolase